MANQAVIEPWNARKGHGYFILPTMQQFTLHFLLTLLPVSCYSCCHGCSFQAFDWLEYRRIWLLRSSTKTHNNFHGYQMKFWKINCDLYHVLCGTIKYFTSRSLQKSVLFCFVFHFFFFHFLFIFLFYSFSSL